jgi:hypothetical protein
VPNSEINKPIEKTVAHLYTSDLCKQLVLWAWSRKAEDVVFTPGVVDCIMFVANEMGKKYSAAIPLVEPAEQRIKIARLSVAAAARVFSTDESYEKVIVEPKHVKFVWEYLMEMYSKPSMGYDIYSLSQKKETTLGNEDEIRDAFTKLYPAFSGAKSEEMLRDVVSYIADSQQLTVSDLCDLTGLERPEIKSFISTLVRKRAIKKRYTFYAKTPAFIRWIRKYQQELGGNNAQGA